MTIVVLYKLIDKCIGIQLFTDPKPRTLAEAKHHTHTQSFDNRLMERPARFCELWNATLNVFLSRRAFEYDVAGRCFLRIKIYLAQQMQNSRLHPRSTRRTASPYFILILRTVFRLAS